MGDARTVSAILESNDLKKPHLVALLATAGQEREIRDIDQELFDGGGNDDSNDEDYCDMSDAAASEIEGRPHSRKRLRRAEGKGYRRQRCGNPFHSFPQHLI